MMAFLPFTVFLTAVACDQWHRLTVNESFPVVAATSVVIVVMFPTLHSSVVFLHRVRRAHLTEHTQRSTDQ